MAASSVWISARHGPANVGDNPPRRPDARRWGEANHKHARPGRSCPHRCLRRNAPVPGSTRRRALRAPGQAARPVVPSQGEFLLRRLVGVKGASRCHEAGGPFTQHRPWIVGRERLRLAQTPQRIVEQVLVAVHLGQPLPAFRFFLGGPVWSPSAAGAWRPSLARRRANRNFASATRGSVAAGDRSAAARSRRSAGSSRWWARKNSRIGALTVSSLDGVPGGTATARRNQRFDPFADRGRRGPRSIRLGRAVRRGIDRSPPLKPRVRPCWRAGGRVSGVSRGLVARAG